MELVSAIEQKRQVSKHADDLVSKLKYEAIRNPLFNDVMHVFALRKRARQQVTMGSLKAMMLRAGFKHHDPKSYANTLKVMGDLGLGTLTYDSKNRIKALKNITLTLQTIGQAAVNKDSKLRKFKQRAKLKKLIADVPQAVVEEQFRQVKPAKQIASKHSTVKLNFTATIDGKEVTFNIPDVTKEEFGQFIASLYPRKPWKGE